MSVELENGETAQIVQEEEVCEKVIEENNENPVENGNGKNDNESENGIAGELNEVIDVNENGVAQICVEEVCEKIVERQPQQNGPKKVAMCTSMDTETVRAAYDDVRADNTETQWAVFKFDGPRIVCSSKGTSFDEFKEQFLENERAFGYIRIQTGDEMSKRQKFLFVTWVGSGVSVIQRAKMSTDKSVIKNIICNFAVELQMESHSDIDLQFFIESLNKASGANYGTGIREN